jgi:hypothetical protein
MKLIDMLAGRESDDPKDKPSGVKVTVETSVGLLEKIDAQAKAKGLTREECLVAYCALGTVAERSAQGIMGVLAGFAEGKGVDDGKTLTGLQRKELRLAEGLAAKNALDEAIKACKDVRGSSQQVEYMTRRYPATRSRRGGRRLRASTPLRRSRSGSSTRRPRRRHHELADHDLRSLLDPPQAA